MHIFHRYFLFHKISPTKQKPPTPSTLFCASSWRIIANTMFTGPWEVIKVRWGEWPAESNNAHQIGYCKPKQQKFLSKNSLPAKKLTLKLIRCSPTQVFLLSSTAQVQVKGVNIQIFPTWSVLLWTLKLSFFSWATLKLSMDLSPPLLDSNHGGGVLRILRSSVKTIILKHGLYKLRCWTQRHAKLAEFSAHMCQMDLYW